MNIEPKSGEIWQHFKGASYHIMGVSKSLHIPDYPPHYWAKHTETEETLAVYHYENDIELTLTKEGDNSHR